MQHKLKSVFRRSSKSRGSPELEGTHHIEPISPRDGRRRISSDQHSRTSVESSVTGSPVYKGRSRPVSSIYDDRRLSQASARNTAATDLTASSDSNGGAIANDYKAYLPALSPVDDNHGDEYMSLGGDRRHISGDSGDGTKRTSQTAILRVLVQRSMGKVGAQQSLHTINPKGMPQVSADSRHLANILLTMF